MVTAFYKKKAIVATFWHEKIAVASLIYFYPPFRTRSDIAYMSALKVSLYASSCEVAAMASMSASRVAKLGQETRPEPSHTLLLAVITSSSLGFSPLHTRTAIYKEF